MNLKIVNRLQDELTLEEAPLKWLLNVRELPLEGTSGEKLANQEELLLLNEQLKDEHDLEVKSLCCAYEIKSKKLESLKKSSSDLVEGCRGAFHLRAELRQTCVVTLERIKTLVEEEFFQDFTSEGHRLKAVPQSDEIDDPFAEDPPIPLNKGKIQLGPLVFQYLSMAIDPNPRKPGASFEGKGGQNHDVEDEFLSPFVVLKQYGRKK
jgi:hypothetical protein